MILALRFHVRALFSPPFSRSFPSSKHFPPLKKPSFPVRRYSSSSSGLSVKMSNQTIEHIVLFKVKDDVESSKVNTMLTGLNALSSLDQVLHITAAPVLRNRSSSFNFTHILHSRYKSKEDLDAYSAHSDHVSVVNEAVRPICEDVMAVDWVAEDLQGPVAPPPGSAIRVSFLKLNENSDDGAKIEILGVIGGIKEKFGLINQLTVGENFSPGRAKGFSLASIAIFPGLSELDSVDSDQELVNSQKEMVRDYIKSVIVVDYLVPSPPQNASL